MALLQLAVVRLATWNVNSIRSRADRVAAWLQRRDVDVLALQETKCRDDQFPESRFTELGYQVAHVGFSQWNGVAILSRVGLDDVEGHLLGGMAAWVASGRPTQALPQLAVSDVAASLAAGELSVLDVRDDSEWEGGHVAGAIHVRGGEVLQRAAELPADDTPLAVMCQTGYRSSVVASVLQREGRSGVLNVPGGVGAWQAAGLPLEQD